VLDEEARELLQEVADMAGTIGDEAPVERFYHEHEVGTLFDRCRGMFDAVLVLLDNGFVQEAAMLCRPLFVDSLALAEIAAADEKRRISLVVGRQLNAIADIDGIFVRCKRAATRSPRTSNTLPHAAAGSSNTHVSTTPARGTGIPRITSGRSQTSTAVATSTPRTA
jgi:hypothetical protein